MYLDGAVKLELLGHHHRDELFHLVDRNRTYLRQWLPWLDDNTTPADTEKFLRSAVSQYRAGSGSQYAMFHHEAMCGVCGINYGDKQNRIATIGYWLGEDYCGKGIVTRAVAKLLEVGFESYGVNKIEIRCATGNHKSRAIPERLGFRFEAILRENEYLYGHFVDHALYAMLASEYAEKRKITDGAPSGFDNPAGTHY